MKIGITGGIGTGKSTVCSIFEIFNIPVYYADTEAKRLMRESTSIKHKVVELFGSEAYFNGELNRKYIASMVFNDASALDKLNAVVHPIVIEDYKEWERRQKSLYTLKEAALLFESGSYLDSDFNILVSSPLELRVTRVMQRDGIERADVERRIAKQMPEKDKEKLADFIIHNDESQSLIVQALDIHLKILKIIDDKR